MNGKAKQLNGGNLSLLIEMPLKATHAIFVIVLLLLSCK